MYSRNEKPHQLLGPFERPSAIYSNIRCNRIARRDFPGSSFTTALRDPNAAIEQDPDKEAEDMGRGPPHLETARRELVLAQQILRLSSDGNLDTNLQDAVFVCIDCEAFEHDHSKITEIGVAILDTRDIKGIALADGATTWIEKMKYAHYRPIEYAQCLNRRFVKGCEDRFNFGTTSWIKLLDAGRVLHRIFLDPTNIHRAADFEMEALDQERNIIFAAHGLRNDRAFLNELGFSHLENSNVVRTMDTQILAGGTKKSPVGLQRLLLRLGLDPVNLHNAGNDAAYTLQALVIMALKDYERPGSIFPIPVARLDKLPPSKHTHIIAPHVYAGTAVDPMNEHSSFGESNPSAESIVPPQTLEHHTKTGQKRRFSSSGDDEAPPSRDHPNKVVMLNAQIVEGSEMCNGRIDNFD
ncbi:hypothetical protein LTR37_011520 [Vermiconidia calcicola]|uniref:Uncharacterized protein n=1 Tax=Vermiconidia calcicola TaxID=1690605 RepID=A0ACC3N239_9PEZI|nr:hypothetical protein LTR37_011520 [Vermiconidia calcicola]